MNYKSPCCVHLKQSSQNNEAWYSK